MSNTMNTPPTTRRQLLSTVSALALLGSAYTAQAADNDADRPTLWIELGGQMENVSGQGEVFAPPFLAVNSTSSVMLSPSPRQAQKPPISFGEEGKISFQPEGSDWVFSAAVLIGRSSNFRHVDHQTNGTFHSKYKSGSAKYPDQAPLTVENFANTQVHHRESHAVLDFSAGKDVGLGMLGRDSSSVLSLGVRFAQFASKETFDIRARPDLQFKYQTFAAYYPGFALNLPHYHAYHATGQASRSFRGIGPSLSWNGSAPFTGNSQDGEITLDWGVNAALLFGRQKAQVQHQETAHYEGVLGKFQKAYRYQLVYHYTGEGHSNARSVTVPNVGGSVGLSWRVHDFKVSLGYRADVFFGAMDTGIDAAKKSNLSFNGPYASISIGLGD